VGYLSFFDAKVPILDAFFRNASVAYNFGRAFTKVA